MHLEQGAAQLVDEGVGLAAGRLGPGDWRQKVTRAGQAVGACAMRPGQRCCPGLLADPCCQP